MQKAPLSISKVTALSLALACATLTFAQTTTPIDSLAKNAFGWTQEERELAFLHFDEVFNGRDVNEGDTINELPTGKPIAAFSEGGEKAQYFTDFMEEHKMAGILVLQDGVIRLERYAMGHNEEIRWTSQSVAKSVTSTLVGAAIKDGYIKSVDDFVTDYIPDLKGSAYDKVTVRHLLMMKTGVKWSETYEGLDSDLPRLFMKPLEPGLDQTVNYLKDLEADAEPGTKWLYNTAESHLLGYLVSTVTGQTLSDYLSSKIWVPYGMEGKATWLMGRTGGELAGCCLQMKLRDFGRYGQFVLEGGRIGGESIVPDGWFKEATQMHSVLFPGMGYGYQWWIYGDGTFQALGIHGQLIHIDPSRQLVIVINSVWPEAESYARHMATSGLLKSIARELDEEKKE